MTYEYSMNKVYANTILKVFCKNEKGSKQDILCRYVNQQHDIKGTCTRVIVE